MANNKRTVDSVIADAERLAQVGGTRQSERKSRSSKKTETP